MKAWFARVWRAMRSKPAPPAEVPNVGAGPMESFEHAFSSRVSGCRRDCACGREFFDNYNSGYDWDEGEQDALARNPNATPLPYSVGSVSFEGTEYVYDCDCWKPRAKRIVSFLLHHEHEIAEFLSEERKRRRYAADKAPVVSE